MSELPTQDDCVAWLERLVAFDTTSRNSNLDLIDDVRAHLATLGIETRLTFNAERTKANLWATFGPDGPGGVVLSGHTDVVPVDDQDWTSDPFTVAHRDGRLYGRGVADMKGFIACCMAHAQRFAAADLKVPLHFAFSYDEEVGCTGVKGLIRDLEENLPRPLAVIVGEPTLMGIVGGHKGGQGYRITVHGVSGHSSDPANGANAVFAAARIVRAAEEMQDRMKAACDPENGFEPPYTTFNVGTIHGGSAHNIIPERCEMIMSFRNTPFDDHEAIDRALRERIAEVEAYLQEQDASARIEVEHTFGLPAMRPDEDSAAEQLIRRLTGLNRSGRVAYGTEAAHFQQAGVPGVVFGPGSIDQAHKPDEWIDVAQIGQCNDFLVKLTDWARSG